MPRAPTLPALLLALPLLALSANAGADMPNINPGMWEYTNTTSMEGPQGIPQQTETSRECITRDDLERQEEMLEVPDECTLDDVNMDPDEVTYSMSCADPMGGTMTMEAEMQFHGNRSEGVMSSEINTPMGTMNVRVDIRGERIGDC
ncbi:MAG: DUF3617 domain-containing protein [Pseudomonadota bacterium]